MEAAAIEQGQIVKVPEFHLLGFPAASVEVVERRPASGDWFLVRYPDGRTLAVHASDLSG